MFGQSFVEHGEVGINKVGYAHVIIDQLLDKGEGFA